MFVSGEAVARDRAVLRKHGIRFVFNASGDVVDAVFKEVRA